MKIKILILLLLSFCFTLHSKAQNIYAVSGIVNDTSAKIKLANTTVMVLSAKDSILQKFTRVAADGRFVIRGLNKGKFLLRLSYPEYATYSEIFTLDSARQHHDFGSIGMTLKSKLLHDVIIKGEITPIKIKGDTTEFNARAYVIQPNSKVEDLLKQLPGIQVDKDGKITAYGETVTKVLVDGEEFFGDDPTLVTRNIRGDMVDKVQLYDKKSDQAAFTGIDDGIKNKTINIKLKEDKKNGYFGKLEGGTATNEYEQGQALYNKFKAQEKISAYATAANTAQMGLTWQGGGNNNGDPAYSGRGTPNAKTGGLHYDSKWNKDKQSINADYKAAYLEVDGVENTITQNNLPGNVINGSSDQSFKNSNFRQKLDASYQITIDTTSNLKIAFDGTSGNTKNNSSYGTINRRGNDFLLNTNNRDVTNDTEQDVFNFSVFYSKKLRKKGRTYSVSLNGTLNNSDNQGYLKSEAVFYNNSGTRDSTQTINQYKTNKSSNNQFVSNITYSEPLTKHLSLIFNYGLSVNRNSSDQTSFNQSPAGTFDLPDRSLSSNFQLDQLANQAGAFFYYPNGKATMNIGTKASVVDFDQKDQYTGSIFKKTFINWNPQAYYKYKFSQQADFQINYYGNTVQPEISQLQPVRVNTDPLYVTLGNINLTPSFKNSVSAYYSSYRVLSGQSIHMTLSYSFTTNPIVYNTVTDTTGKTVSQPFNLPGRNPYSLHLDIGTNKRIKGADMNIGFTGSVNLSTSYNLSNNVLNATTTNVYSLQISLTKFREKKYDIDLFFGPTYNINQSSLNPNINDNGKGFLGFGFFKYYLPAKFEIRTDLSYTYTAKTRTFAQDINSIKWNAAFSKAFLKQDNLKLSLSANDLLNQNNGFNRTAIGNLITQNTFTTIKRYLMFSITLDFNKMGGAPAK